MKRIVLFGSGKLTKIIVNCYLKGELKGYEIVGCYSKTKEHRDEISNILKIKPCESFESLLDLKPDYLVEATNPSATKEILESTIKNHINVILLSIGALADESYYKYIEDLATFNNVKIHLASGAISGFEVLRTARLIGLTKAKLTNTKGPKALRKNILYNKEMETTNYKAFVGSAYEAIQNLPTGINVGVATALATRGVHDTQIEIKTEPNFIGDSQCIDIKCGNEIKAHLDVYSATSDIAGYSVVALLQNLNSSIVF
ncbi:MAG: DUF108 domain-containing protein [Acholeplasmatales bacterium]|nr:DUF108 domain-containing protein [Acholeplasmatales bacterium]